MAEGAGERAADLARNAQRAAAFLGDIDGLDLDRLAGAARRKAQQPFARAVGGDLFVDDFRPGDRVARGEVAGGDGHRMVVGAGRASQRVENPVRAGGYHVGWQILESCGQSVIDEFFGRGVHIVLPSLSRRVMR